MMLARLFRLILEQDPFWNYPKGRSPVIQSIMAIEHNLFHAQPMNPAAQQLPDQTGKTLSEVIIILESYGFQFQTSTKGNYQSFEHPDGSIIHIRPNGEIVRTGPKIRGTDGKTYRRRYNRDGNQIKFEPGANTHSTGEKVIL